MNTDRTKRETSDFDQKATLPSGKTEVSHGQKGTIQGRQKIVSQVLESLDRR
jgi:hypothetical protein